MADLFARRFAAAHGGAKDLYDIKLHVERRGQHAAPGSVAWFLASLRDGAYADGGYPKYWLTADGGTLSYAACKANCARIARAIRGDASRADRDPARFYSSDAQWRVVAVDINWEDASMFCDDTGERIPSAYAEDDAPDCNCDQCPPGGPYTCIRND
jgi:hypothetical protein